MRERIVQFGDGGRLSGVLAIAAEAPPNLPPALFFNAGVVHRVGAHRLNVKIARRLAADGVSSLRFDLSGLGDSPPAREALGYEQQSIEDIQAALDCLEAEIGQTSAIAIGMCSGADNAYRAAVVEDRLVGAVLMDPYAYEAPGAKLDYMADRAANPDRWAQKVKKLVTGGEGRDEQSAEVTEGRAIDLDRDQPPLEVFGSDLETITARGAKLLLLYTAYVQGKIMKPAHFDKLFNAFDFGENLQVEVRGDVDHTYTELSAQSALLDRISAWIKEEWGAGAG